jgi:hypothetical protein
LTFCVCQCAWIRFFPSSFLPRTDGECEIIGFCLAFFVMERCCPLLSPRRRLSGCDPGILLYTSCAGGDVERLRRGVHCVCGAAPFRPQVNVPRKRRGCPVAGTRRARSARPRRGWGVGDERKFGRVVMVLAWQFLCFGLVFVCACARVLILRFVHGPNIVAGVRCPRRPTAAAAAAA